MNDKLKALYKTVILQHESTPYRFEKRESATQKVEAKNTICGDRFDIYFEINEGVITDISFHGFGCAISKASTSILVKKIENQPVDKAKSIIELFLKYVTTNSDVTVTDDEFTAFSAAKDFPGRMKCATLAWEEINNKLMEVKVDNKKSV